MSKNIIFVISILALLAIGATSKNFFLKSNETTEESKDFSSYWYDGKAEVSSYTLSQNRYGEIREGHTVLIFVTEDFSKKNQVKLDDPQKAGSDKQSILKLNFTKNFITGIYPYSILNSVFTPVDLSGTVKTSCSIQEWCGHTFTQLNKTKSGYKTSEFSYFESEGDKTQNLGDEILEDELWTMIRINPEKIKTGKQKLIIGNMAVRLLHKKLEVVDVNISRTTKKLEEKEYQELTVQFRDRTLQIYYDKSFPYTIQGWEETSTTKGKNITTIARLKKSIRLPYWQLNHNKDIVYRDSLGI